MINRRDCRAAGLTDAGTTRQHNEDRFAIDESIGLYLVSDGMGGARAGEVASALVAEAVPSQLAASLVALEGANVCKRAEALRAAIMGVSNGMWVQSERDDRVQGMGATIVACLIHEGTAILAHMGDSRAYLMRGGGLEQLTEDHGLVDTLVKLGQISKRGARKHPAKHVLTRYMGMEGDSQPDVGLLKMVTGDRILLCSDGLTNMVPDRRIAELLWREQGAEDVCERLITDANEAGGDDNVTVVVVDCGGPRPARSKRDRVVVRRKVGTSLDGIVIGELRTDWSERADDGD